MVKLFSDYEKKLLHTLADVFEIGVPCENNTQYVDCIKHLRETAEPDVQAAMQAIKDSD